jgi:organic hydroperoxide reductase OsmC/OhrA
MSQDPHDYPVTVRWIGEKEGVAESLDDLPPLPVSSPPQFGGPHGVWSPEHLLVAATSACLMSTFLAIANFSGLQVLWFEAPATGTLTRGEDRRYRMSRIVIRPRVTVTREADHERALRLLDKAHETCLVTRSLSSEVVIEPSVEIAHPEPVLI